MASRPRRPAAVFRYPIVLGSLVPFPGRRPHGRRGRRCPRPARSSVLRSARRRVARRRSRQIHSSGAGATRRTLVGAAAGRWPGSPAAVLTATTAAVSGDHPGSACPSAGPVRAVGSAYRSPSRRPSRCRCSDQRPVATRASATSPRRTPLDWIHQSSERSGSTVIAPSSASAGGKPVGVVVDGRPSRRSRPPGRPAPRSTSRAARVAVLPDQVVLQPAVVVQAQRRHPDGDARLDAHPRRLGEEPAGRLPCTRAGEGCPNQPPRLGGRGPRTDDRAEPAVRRLRPARRRGRSGSPTPTGCTSTSWTPTSCRT